MTPSTVPCPTCKGDGLDSVRISPDGPVYVPCPEPHCVDGFMSTDWTAAIARAVMDAEFVGMPGYTPLVRVIVNGTPVDRLHAAGAFDALRSVRP